MRSSTEILHKYTNTRIHKCTNIAKILISKQKIMMSSNIMVYFIWELFTARHCRYFKDRDHGCDDNHGGKCTLYLLQRRAAPLWSFDSKKTYILFVTLNMVINYHTIS